MSSLVQLLAEEQLQGDVRRSLEELTARGNEL